MPGTLQDIGTHSEQARHSPMLHEAYSLEEVRDKNKNQTNCLYGENFNKDVLRALLEEDMSVEWYCF